MSDPSLTPEQISKAQKLLNAAYEFWKTFNGKTAVHWLEDTNNHLLIFTRGEYRDQLMKNIHPLTSNQLFKNEER